MSMNIQKQSRQEYYLRINRVVDYIDAHLDEEHNLEKLSQVAHFSPFHFHRIFRVLTGETINNYVKRIRLQRAGSMLISDDQRSVSEVSALCGFNSTAVFCRAFKSHYGKSTGEFRTYWKKQESKNGQADRKDDQYELRSSSYFSDEFLNLNRDFNMETNIAVKEMPAMDLIYCRHTGPFDQIGGAYEKLFKWAGPRGLLRFPETKTLTVYHDDPKVVDIEKLRQSACITVDEDARPEGEFGKMHLPGGKCVVGSFKVKPHQFGEAWDAVCLWMADSGYQPSDGYPYEYYPEEHSHENPPTFTVDICVPVKPL
ncbi:MAG: AraC family transcriptional regulator [Bacteroidales bacterium]|nr:AraC family transcriptional regulator [Bacteroidales bacterium]